jgi:hypothetical protein
MNLSVITLSDNMHRSKTDLLAYINYFYPIHTIEYEDAAFLVQNISEVRKWISIWNGNQDDVEQTNILFREWKIQQMMDDDFDEYRDLLYLDEQDWLESYYQQPYTKRTQYELDRVLDELTVEQLWQIHKEYPLARIEYY